MKIVELDAHSVNPGDLSWDGIKELGELQLYDRTAPEEVIDRAKDADAILINKINITEDVIKSLPKLRYIGEMATGYNNIDIKAAANSGITVTNIPSYSTDSVAQLVFAHILNVASHVDHYARETRQGVWSRNPDFCYWNTPLIELAGKSIGIVGLGHIGMRVAEIAHCFGMQVTAVTSKDKQVLPEWIRKATLDGMLSSSDIITLHCPLTSDNLHMINAEAIALTHDNAILVNTGRGALVDDAAVADALRSGKLAAYCADVMADEPPKADNPLLSCDNAYITPHIAWATHEARQRLMTTAVNNLKAFINGKPINVVK